MTNILRRMKKFAELNEESRRLPKYLIHKMTIILCDTVGLQQREQWNPTFFLESVFFGESYSLAS